MTQFSVFKTWMVARLSNDEKGANLVEYILLVAFIALIVVGAVVFLQGEVSTKFNDAGNCLNQAPASC